VQIRWLVMARYVEVHDGLGTIIGAGVDGILVQELPADVVVNMALRVVGRAEEWAQFHVTAQVSGPDLETVFEHAYPFGISGVTVADERFDPAFTLPLAVVFPAHAEGLHTITLEVDGGSASTMVGVTLMENPPDS
jgi:hypothetical protein